MAIRQTDAPAPVMSAPRVVAEDERGVIEQLVKGDFQSVLRISSKRGTVRANHYHQHDSHLCYLAEGKIRYVECPVLAHETSDASAEPSLGEQTEYIVEPGQLFYTAPMIAHAMEFLEDSVFYCFTPRSAAQDEYENDVIRVVLVDPHEAAQRA